MESQALVVSRCAGAHQSYARHLNPLQKPDTKTKGRKNTRCPLVYVTGWITITPHARHPAARLLTVRCKLTPGHSPFSPIQCSAHSAFVQARFHGHLGPPPGPTHIDCPRPHRHLKRALAGQHEVPECCEGKRSLSSAEVVDWRVSLASPICSASMVHFGGLSSLLACWHHLHHPTKELRVLCARALQPHDESTTHPSTSLPPC